MYRRAVPAAIPRAALALVLLGCGSGATPRPVRGPASGAREPASAPGPIAAEPSDDGAPTGRQRYGYAQTPLTRLARAMTDVAFAALRGTRLDATEGIDLVDAEGGGETAASPCASPSAEVAPLCANLALARPLGVQVDLGVALRGQGDQRPGIFGHFFVGPPRVAVITLHAGPDLGAQPRWSRLPGNLPDAAAEVALFLAALAGDPGSVLVTADEVGHAGLASLFREARPEPHVLAEAGELARAGLEVAGFDTDDYFVYLRGADGHAYAVRVLARVGEDGALRLRRDVLVRRMAP